MNNQGDNGVCDAHYDIRNNFMYINPTTGQGVQSANSGSWSIFGQKQYSYEIVTILLCTYIRSGTVAVGTIKGNFYYFIQEIIAN